MKTLNKFRFTNTFTFTGVVAEMIAQLHQHYGRKLIAAGYDAKDESGTFTVRILEDDGGLYDVRVSPWTTRVHELERVTIVAPATVA